MQHLKEIVLPNYPLVLSLLKYRNVWVFWNKKKSSSNRCSPLNNSIDKKKIIKNNSSLSQIYFKFYSNVTTYNQGCEYV